MTDEEESQMTDLPDQNDCTCTDCQIERGELKSDGDLLVERHATIEAFRTAASQLDLRCHDGKPGVPCYECGACLMRAVMTATAPPIAAPRTEPPGSVIFTVDAGQTRITEYPPIGGHFNVSHALVLDNSGSHYMVVEGDQIELCDDFGTTISARAIAWSASAPDVQWTTYEVVEITQPGTQDLSMKERIGSATFTDE